MVRGTFANTRIKNKLLGGAEGGDTLHMPSGERLSIYDAAMKYKAEKVPTIVLAGKEYGTGSSRDWAAKGPYLLGVRAVIAESFERIHRSNLVGMGVLPLQFLEGQSAEAWASRATRSSRSPASPRRSKAAGRRARASRSATKDKKFDVLLRIDTPNEVQYYRNGGILQYVLRRLLAGG